MSSHHRHHHHHPHEINHHPVPTNISCCYNCTNTNFNSIPCCTQPHPPPPQLQQPSSDQLLQLITSYLQQQQQYSQLRPRFRQHHKIQLSQPPEVQLLLSSLLHRIEALEIGFDRYSSSYNSSLRDAAARVIQTRFRAYLVRRSRTLRNLKELGVIKSSFHSLKSSVSGKTHFDFGHVRDKAIDLLLKLDSIQDDDLMIRDGKRSLCLELLRFREFVDGRVAVRREEISRRVVKNVRSAGNSNKSRTGLGTSRRETEELLKQIEKVCVKYDDENARREGLSRVIVESEEIPMKSVDGKGRASKFRHGVLVKSGKGESRVKKAVSFSENGNVYRVYRNTPEPTSSGEDNYTDESDERGEIMENGYNEVEEIKCVPKENVDDEEAACVENEESSSPSCDGEMSPKRNEANSHVRKKGSLLFSAPLPLKMEPRADFYKEK